MRFHSLTGKALAEYLVVFLFWEQTAKNMPETKSGRLCFGHAAFGLF